MIHFNDVIKSSIIPHFPLLTWPTIQPIMNICNQQLLLVSTSLTHGRGRQHVAEINFSKNQCNWLDNKWVGENNFKQYIHWIHKKSQYNALSTAIHLIKQIFICGTWVNALYKNKQRLRKHLTATIVNFPDLKPYWTRSP